MQTAILERAAAAGNANAAAELAFAYLQGRGVPRSLRRSREYFGRAAELGHLPARCIYLSFLGNGTGGERDWPHALALLKQTAEEGNHDAARQIELLEAMDLTAGGNAAKAPASERLSSRPEVSLLRNFLTDAECRYLIDAATLTFQPATVGHLAGGVAQHVVRQIRTCDVAAFPWLAENPVIHAINRRIAAASGTAAEWGEPLQIFRYRAGQEFKPHRDCTGDIENQRVFTMLVYLNDDYSGGETEFLETGLKVRGATGDAVLFRNASQDGTPDLSTLHAGLPVTAGEKLLASRWIRQKRFGPLD
jgi:prolyl 4-hydroxylase